MKKDKDTLIAQNKKARHNYIIEDTFEAGLVLKGTEIKAIREGKVNLRDSFIRVDNCEAFVHNMHIGEYVHGNRFNHEPLRTRKLLLHKKEIKGLIGIQKEAGYSFVPLKLYLNNGRAKLLFGVAKGKKAYDKRQDLKAKDAKREVEKALKLSNR